MFSQLGRTSQQQLSSLDTNNVTQNTRSHRVQVIKRGNKKIITIDGSGDVRSYLKRPCIFCDMSRYEVDRWSKTMQYCKVTLSFSLVNFDLCLFWHVLDLENGIKESLIKQRSGECASKTFVCGQHKMSTLKGQLKCFAVPAPSPQGEILI